MEAHVDARAEPGTGGVTVADTEAVPPATAVAETARGRVGLRAEVELRRPAPRARKPERVSVEVALGHGPPPRKPRGDGGRVLRPAAVPVLPHVHAPGKVPPSRRRARLARLRRL